MIVITTVSSCNIFKRIEKFMSDRYSDSIWENRLIGMKCSINYFHDSDDYYLFWKLRDEIKFKKNVKKYLKRDFQSENIQKPKDSLLLVILCELTNILF